MEHALIGIMCLYLLSYFAGDGRVFTPNSVVQKESLSSKKFIFTCNFFSFLFFFLNSDSVLKITYFSFFYQSYLRRHGIGHDDLLVYMENNELLGKTIDDLSLFFFCLINLSI